MANGPSGRWVEIATNPAEEERHPVDRSRGYGATGSYPSVDPGTGSYPRMNGHTGTYPSVDPRSTGHYPTANGYEDATGSYPAMGRGQEAGNSGLLGWVNGLATGGPAGDDGPPTGTFNAYGYEPAYQEPAYPQPPYRESAYAQPAYAQPHYHEPAYPEPQYSEPQYPGPQYPEPAYAQPQYPGPAYAAPQYPEPHQFDSAATAVWPAGQFEVPRGMEAVPPARPGPLALEAGPGVWQTDEYPGYDIQDQLREALPLPGTRAEIRRALFAPPPEPPVGLASDWLRPEAGILPRQPRAEVDEVIAWCRSPDRGPLLRLLCGAGGQGKTHAALQICTALEADGWLAGFVALPPATWRTTTQEDIELTGPDRPQWEERLMRAPELIAGIRAVAESQSPTLLVVDQAEYAGPLVSELLNTIAEYEAQQWIRVLLLARSPDGWFTDLSEAHRLRSWVTPTPAWLPSLPQQLGGPQAKIVWKQAVAAFAERAVADGVLPAVDLRGLTSPEPAGLWATTLDFYADAALRVLDVTGPTVRRHQRRDGGGPDPIAGVLAYERRQVSAVLDAAGCALEDVQRDWAVTVVSLRPAATAEAAYVALGSVPAPWQVPEELRGPVAAALARLYRGPAEQGWVAPRPNRMVDANLLDLAGSLSDPEWSAALAEICADVDPLAAIHTATTLIRCLSAPAPSRRQERAKRRISVSLPRLLRASASRYATPFTVLAPQQFTEAVTDLLASGEDRGVPIATARQLDSLILSIGFTPSRAAIAVAVSERMVAAARPGLDSGAYELSEYARCLNNLGIRLAALGRDEEALSPAEEAAAVQRRLATADPAYLPDLALSLDLLGNGLADAGRPDEALSPAEEAVSCYRRLIAAGSIDHLPDLASALNTLGTRLGAAGLRGPAVAPIEEAVAIIRRLVPTNRAVHQPDLAFSLSNLAKALADISHWDEALRPAEEAVAVYRKLTVVNAALHLPELAMALNNLGNWLARAGRHDDALVPAEEAAVIYRRLAAGNSTYLVNLAASLNNLGIRLAESGRHADALTPIEEAVAVYRRLADTNAEEYLPELAQALHNLGNRLIRLARPAEAIAPLEDSVAVRRRLLDTDPAVQLPELARSLATASTTLTASGRHEEAAEVASEAVDVLESMPQPDDSLLMAALRIRGDALAALAESTGTHARLRALE